MLVSHVSCLHCPFKLFPASSISHSDSKEILLHPVKTCCDTFPWLPMKPFSHFVKQHMHSQRCPYLNWNAFTSSRSHLLLHLLFHIHIIFPAGTHTKTNLDWISVTDDWCDRRQRLLSPFSVLSHLFPLYRPAALCWYRAEIWTGVTWVICPHGLEQWLAKTGQLSSV